MRCFCAVRGLSALVHRYAHLVGCLCGVRDFLAPIPWYARLVGCVCCPVLLCACSPIRVPCLVSLAPWCSFTGVSAVCVASAVSVPPWRTFTGLHVGGVCCSLVLIYCPACHVRCPWLLGACAPGCVRCAFCVWCSWLLGARSRACAPCTLCVRCLWILGSCSPLCAPCALCCVVLYAVLMACPAVAPRALPAFVCVAGPARFSSGGCFPGPPHKLAVFLSCCSLIVGGSVPLCEASQRRVCVPCLVRSGCSRCASKPPSHHGTFPYGML